MEKDLLVFDSYEERIYYDWLIELKNEKYISNITLQPQYSIIDSVKIKVINKKDKEVEYTILNGVSYTADFKVEWTDKAKDIFIYTDSSKIDSNWNVFKSKMHYVDSNNISVIDVKGTFAGKNNNSAVTFPLVRKMMFDKHGIFVNKIVPLASNGLFANTFTPFSYTKTKTGKDKKINWDYKNLNDYINDTRTNNESTSS